jgi:hypothetical protein
MAGAYFETAELVATERREGFSNVTATPDGPDLATRLDRLLGLKDTAHYGATLVAPPNANLAMRWARQLVTRAQEELER